MHIQKCKCGHIAQQTQRVKQLKDGFVIKCSNEACPAVSQQIGELNTINSWNEMASKH